MLRFIHRWWDRVVERRRAARRAAEVGRWSYAPFYRHGSLGKPRFGRFDTFFNPLRWLHRALWVVLLLFLAWFLWESWHGLAIFNG